MHRLLLFYVTKKSPTGFFSGSVTEPWRDVRRPSCNHLLLLVFTTGNELQMECLWFCFSGLIQQDVDRVKEHWNSHYIRGSRYDTVKGRPNELFYLPELHNTEDFLAPVSAQQCDYISVTMNTRSIFSMPFKLQDFQTPKTGEKP